MRIKLLKDWKPEGSDETYKAGTTLGLDDKNEALALIGDGIADPVRHEPETPPKEEDWEKKVASLVKDEVTKATAKPENKITGETIKEVKVRPAWLDDPKFGFKRDIDFLREVLIAGKTPHTPPRDERLRHLSADRVTKTVGSDEQQTGSDPLGGYLVPEAFLPEVFQVGAEAQRVQAQMRTTPLPMEAPTVKVRARVDKNHSSSVSGGLVVYRRAETTALTASQMTFEEITYEATMLGALSYVSEELLSDSPISMAALISAGFQDEFPSKLCDERINGTGVGEFEGILASPAKIAVTSTLINGDACDASSFEYDHAVKMRARAWRYDRSVWHANHDVIPQLMTMNYPIGLGGGLAWQQSVTADMPDMLLGRPIYFTEYCQTLGTEGDVILVDWSQYLEGTYQPLQSASSIHVRFVNHERAFKFWLRNAGACWWRSALTPKNSTSTLSPILTLASR